MHLGVQKYKQLFLHKKDTLFPEERKCCIACKTKNVSILERFGVVFYVQIFFGF
jgi:hypothetical protein